MSIGAVGLIKRERVGFIACARTRVEYMVKEWRVSLQW
jgi:hypothetical protein